MSYSRDDVLLRIDHVTKRYGDKEVLSDISAEVRDLHCSEAGRIVGQVLAIIGPSGVGKSQLIQIIAGLERPTIGGVFLAGDTHPVKPGSVGVVFQKYSVWNHRRVIGNLQVAGEMSGMTSKQAEERGRYYLDLFDLEGDAARYPAELSGGMQQRLALARQLMNLDGPRSHCSRLMLMDEPFAALDPKNTRKVCGLIRTVADLDDKNTLIVVTHDLRAALSAADLLWVMGRCRDVSGKPISGGKIVRELDLAQMGLTWHPDIYAMPEFMALESELSQMFQTL
jgi:ABC-type nitrate/sulfonate/bicarbonate transport system ATPase subunit